MRVDLRIVALGCIVAAGFVAAAVIIRPVDTATVAAPRDGASRPAALPLPGKPAPVASAAPAPPAAALPGGSSAADAPPAKTPLPSPQASAPVSPSPSAQKPAGHPPVGAAVLPPEKGAAGASKATNPNFTHFRVGDRNVKRILVEGDTVWVATSGGLIRYHTVTDAYRLFDARSGLHSNSIVHVGRLKDRIAVGSYGGGLSVLRADGETWDTYRPAQGLADDFVSDAMNDAKGDVWIATRSGVNRVASGQLAHRARWEVHTVESTKGGLPSNRVYGLALGRDGAVWVATEGGVARHHQGQWQHWTRKVGGEAGADAHQPAKGGNPNFIVSVAVDRAGAVWAGTMGGGLARYKDGQWSYFMRPDGLPGNNVFTLHADDQRQLWIGTDNGLARLQDGKFKILTTQDGLLTNAVFAMAAGPKALWVGGYGGVARIRAVN